MATAPRHAARATRASGRTTRAALLDAAVTLFADTGLGGVSLSEIATRAGCFPSQVTYYFGDKETLFVEAAGRELLAVRDAVQAAADRARTPNGAVRAMVKAALASPAIPLFADAMLLARRRADLQPIVADAFAALHSRAERGAAAVLSSHHWTMPAGPGTQSRAFWSAIIGIALEKAAVGDEFDTRGAEDTVRAVLALSED